MSYSCLINIPFHKIFFISKFKDSYLVNFLLNQGYLLSQLHITYTVYTDLFIAIFTSIQKCNF